MENYQKYIGMALDNRYTVRKLIGTGGMSYVFLATDSVMKRQVAVKILRDEQASDSVALGRFNNECKAISSVSHNNIVKCYDVATSSEIKYFVMEYAAGPTLREYMKKTGIIPAKEVISISASILSALDHIHSKNIIHRDIKPQNIIMTEQAVKVIDFGIAKLPTSDPLTISCTTVGTVDYISPEQASGGAMDARSDIYSLGIMMYEMATGKLPFESDNPMAVANMQINDTPRLPSEINPDIPRGLEQIIMIAINKQPGARFEQASQMRDCLLRLQGNIDATFDFIAFNADVADDVPKQSTDVVFSGSYLMESMQDPKFQDVVIDSDDKADDNVKPRRKRVKKLVKNKIKMRPTRVSILSMTLGVLCALGLVALTAVLYLYETYFTSIISTGKTDVVVIEDFAGQLYTDEMQSKLEDAGFMVTIQWQTDSSAMYGTIISQSPKKNARKTVQSGEYCELTLTLSSGEETVLLGNYVGMEYREALMQLSEKKLNVSIEKVNSETMPYGSVISTVPEGGTTITLDTAIKIYVSMGSQIEYTTVPDLVGLTVIQVSDALKKADVMVGNVTYQRSSTVEAGRVISQSIYKGSTVPTGLTRIDIVISTGP